MSEELAGRAALVTGAGSGIGLATAEAFAGAGAHVCLAYHASSRAPDAALERIATAGGRAFALPVDVSDEASVSRLFADALPRLGTLDILVNNAGIMEEQPLLGHDTALFDRTISINLRGTFLAGRAGISAMVAGGREGRVINVASDLAYLGRANFSAYCASKGAILSLTRSWAREFAPRILVNAIAPGPIETPLLRRSLSNPEVLAQELDSPLARIGTVEEAAACALFLAGPGGAFMTGQTLGPNGGSAMP